MLKINKRKTFSDQVFPSTHVTAIQVYRIMGQTDDKTQTFTQLGKDNHCQNSNVCILY